MSPITVLLAEDHRIIREGLRELLLSETDLTVIAEAENGRQAVSLALKLCPDVVIMDVSMPLINGMAATRQIMQSTVKTKVLILSSHNEDVFIEQAREFGASGYLVRQTDTLMLPDAIRQAYHGTTFLCPSRFPSKRACS